MRIGIEIGGTFTDLVAHDRDNFLVRKVPSVRARPEQGALDALDAAGIDLSTVEEIVHGSTVATNAVLERKGGRVAFVVTQGFEDILYIQRQDRRRIYDLFYSKPVPVVQRQDTVGLKERILSSGAVETALDRASIEEKLVPFLEETECDAVAVCLLNAYADPAHEAIVKEFIRERFPNLPVTISTDVSGEYREYERATTTTLSSYVQPVVAAYLGRLESALKERGFSGRFSMMQSNGGSAPALAVARNAINAFLSGPAAGVVGALRQAQRSGFSNIMTLDIGGTSADMCLVSGGEALLTPEAKIDGLPIKTPMLDINTIGAGGGSIIWVDDGQVLRVGPHSAGANPGPACYGRGGTSPTLTDAHVTRGIIRADAHTGLKSSLDVDAARAALSAVAERFGQDVHELSDNAVRVTNASIAGALQVLSTERGRDPRDYTLVAYGGGGPIHAAEIAEDLSMNAVVVPPYAGAISAYGLLVSDKIHFETLTRIVRLDAGAPASIVEVYDLLRERCLEHFRTLGIIGEPEFGLTLDMRLVGQAFEIPVTLAVPEIEGLSEAVLKEKFELAHEEAYGFAVRGAKPVEIVTFRLRAGIRNDADAIARQSGGDAHDSVGTIFYRGRRSDCRFLNRSLLVKDVVIEGVAVIEDGTSTTFVPPGWTVMLDHADNLVLRRVSS